MKVWIHSKVLAYAVYDDQDRWANSRYFGILRPRNESCNALDYTFYDGCNCIFPPLRDRDGEYYWDDTGEVAGPEWAEHNYWSIDLCFSNNKFALGTLRLNREGEVVKRMLEFGPGGFYAKPGHSFRCVYESDEHRRTPMLVEILEVEGDHEDKVWEDDGSEVDISRNVWEVALEEIKRAKSGRDDAGRDPDDGAVFEHLPEPVQEVQTGAAFSDAAPGHEGQTEGTEV